MVEYRSGAASIADGRYGIPAQRSEGYPEAPYIGPDRRPDPETMAIVQSGLKEIADRPVQLAEAFYGHLFEMAPAVRDMFPADMTAQNEKLCAALIDAIRSLIEPDRYADGMEDGLRRVGHQHARRYGVVPEHYPYVGHALARAVRDVTGDWSIASRSAWVWVYDWVAAHMMSGGHPHAR